MIVDFSSSGDEVADGKALLQKIGENCVGCGFTLADILSDIPS
jgi:hypothetical protein